MKNFISPVLASSKSGPSTLLRINSALCLVGIGVIGFILVNFVVNSYADAIKVPRLDNSSIKKKILILSSKGGGGHTCAANAISNYLKNDYEVVVVNVFCDILGDCDPIKKISFGHSDAEDSYNFLLKYK